MRTPKATWWAAIAGPSQGSMIIPSRESFPARASKFGAHGTDFAGQRLKGLEVERWL